MIRAAERFTVRPTDDHAWGPRQPGPSTGGLLLALAVAAVIGAGIGLFLPLDVPAVAWSGAAEVMPAAGP